MAGKSSASKKQTKSKQGRDKRKKSEQKKTVACNTFEEWVRGELGDSDSFCASESTTSESHAATPPTSSASLPAQAPPGSSKPHSSGCIAPGHVGEQPCIAPAAPAQEGAAGAGGSSAAPSGRPGDATAARPALHMPGAMRELRVRLEGGRLLSTHVPRPPGAAGGGDSVCMDLHSHSTCSDGLLSPADLVARAAKLGVRALALTDHDTMAGTSEALAAGRRLGVRVVPGVEISACAGGSAAPRSAAESVHLLGYFGPGGPRGGGELEECLRRIREGRLARGRAMVEKLRGLGAPLAWGRVLEVCAPGDSSDPEKLRGLGAPLAWGRVLEVAGGEGAPVGRPHVARALVEAGHAASVQEAFSKYLHDGGPAYASGAEVPAEEGVRLIVRCGGVAVLAHPWTLRPATVAPLLARLAAAGLHGMEAYRDASKLAVYGGLAEAHGLLKLGGSDFHGSGGAGEAELGSVRLPVLAADAFLRVAAPIWGGLGDAGGASDTSS